MAVFLAAKTPTDAVERTWYPKLADGDGIASFELDASGCTIDTEAGYPDSVAFYVSAGTAGATATITASVVTHDGAEITETLYLPIIASAAQIADTARDYCGFALRKIVGIGESAESTELDDALEILNAMIAEWREGGADIGCAFPITANTIIYCPDWAVNAIRYNLRLSVYSLYNEQPTPMDVMSARKGLQLVKHKNLPQERMAEYF